MLTAMTPVLSTAVERVTSTLAPHYAVRQVNPIHSRSSNLVALLYATHWLAMTQLSISCCLLALCAAYRISRIFSSLPVSTGYPLLEVSVFLIWEGSDILAALTPQASEVATLLGIGALCHSIKNSTTFLGLHFWTFLLNNPDNAEVFQKCQDGFTVPNMAKSFWNTVKHTIIWHRNWRNFCIRKGDQAHKMYTVCCKATGGRKNTSILHKTMRAGLYPRPVARPATPRLKDHNMDTTKK